MLGEGRAFLLSSMFLGQVSVASKTIPVVAGVSTTNTADIITPSLAFTN